MALRAGGFVLKIPQENCAICDEMWEPGHVTAMWIYTLRDRDYIYIMLLERRCMDDGENWEVWVTDCELHTTPSRPKYSAKSHPIQTVSVEYIADRIEI